MLHLKNLAPKELMPTCNPHRRRINEGGKTCTNPPEEFSNKFYVSSCVLAIHSLVISLWKLMAIRGLTHLPLVPHICVGESGQHWFKQRRIAYSAPSHYLNQCEVIANWTLRNKLLQNTKLFIHKNAYNGIVCEMAAILSGGVGGVI